MKLKCIGGPSDGKVVEMADAYQTQRVADPRRDPMPPFPAPGDLVSPTPMTSTIYTRRVFRERSEAVAEQVQVECLAPYGVSDIEALRHLLASHRVPVETFDFGALQRLRKASP